jgi:hypothetical protein
MSYTIQKTNGDTLAVIPDTEKNTDFGITLIGRNYSGYGIFLNDNFIALLENFAAAVAPAQPIKGQLWFSTADNTIQVWAGAAWKKLSSSTASGTAPTDVGRNIGDFWWDTTNEQLKIWAGTSTSTVLATAASSSYDVTVLTTDNIRQGDQLSSSTVNLTDNVFVTQILTSSVFRVNTPVNAASGQTLTFTKNAGWNLVGPSYTKTQQLTGVFPRDVVDLGGVTRTVGLIYQKGQVIGSISRENEYTPNTATAISRLPIIRPGITLIEDAGQQQVRTVLATAIGANGTTPIYISSTDGLAVGDYVITANIAFTALRNISAIFPGNSTITINTTTTIAVNEAITFQRGSFQSHLFNGTALNSQQLNGITADRFATLVSDQIFQQDITVRGNVYIGGDPQKLPGAGGLKVWDNTGDLYLENRASGGDWNVYTQTAPGVTVRSLYVDGHTGLAQVLATPTDPLGIATKQYVDVLRANAMTAISANVANLVNSAPAGYRNFGDVATVITGHTGQISTINGILTTLAPAASPVFSGNPTAPTPASSDRDTSIATTAFVGAVVDAANASATANAVIQDAQIALRANIDSPAFTGNPTAPTPALTDRDTSIATTYFVGTLVDAANAVASGSSSGKAPINSPVFTGTPSANTPGANLTYTIIDSTTTSLNIPVSHPYPTLLATVGFVANSIATMPSANLAPYATKVSPTLEGTPRSTLAPGNAANSWIATTQWVTNYSPVLTVNGKTGTVQLGVSDITGAAPINSPTFTGIPTLDGDPIRGDTSLRIPTTRWVANIAANLAPQSSPTFIGTVTIPTAVLSSSNETAASTRWVTQFVANASVPRWGGSTRYVDTRAPLTSDGVDGDIWFQYSI